MRTIVVMTSALTLLAVACGGGGSQAPTATYSEEPATLTTKNETWEMTATLPKTRFAADEETHVSLTLKNISDQRRWFLAGCGILFNVVIFGSDGEPLYDSSAWARNASCPHVDATLVEPGDAVPEDLSFEAPPGGETIEAKVAAGESNDGPGRAIPLSVTFQIETR
jgi:hypothetical protein